MLSKWVEQNKLARTEWLEQNKQAFERAERSLLLEALLVVWEQEVEENVFASMAELECCIAWQVLALSGTNERHAESMQKRRERNTG